MKITSILCTLLLFLLPIEGRQQACAVSPDTKTTTPMAVSVDWLDQNLNNPKLVLLHIGVKEEYDAGHIPGAAFITLDDIAAPEEKRAIFLSNCRPRIN